ncbi:hypothetical protein HLB23_06195 [Nocardia uniformis]|uniref:Uncharacterized protein n=1 Tax=Nocardia uniformis TaxID=53432 RepID=A0A849BTI7_9NOCA|nr:hypothetical protein [Nocardia uniformis]NNH69464.1 hypothetical protein [Nocardia uniformis]
MLELRGHDALAADDPAQRGLAQQDFDGQLHAVIVSARASHRLPATLDRADILDLIFDGTEPANRGDVEGSVDDVIRHHTMNMN